MRLGIGKRAVDGEGEGDGEDDVEEDIKAVELERQCCDGRWGWTGIVRSCREFGN